ncbi:hypothetical protein ABS642_07590 [Microbacterium sp. A8/3-1]|uniref:Uncharacterized protein n=1 Tax=Microbacterium sp. A8/3-1 TaxID=3160749 RepID=A0AAU7W0Q6_9MICO
MTALAGVCAAFRVTRNRFALADTPRPSYAWFVRRRQDPGDLLASVAAGVYISLGSAGRERLLASLPEDYAVVLAAHSDDIPSLITFEYYPDGSEQWDRYVWPTAVPMPTFPYTKVERAGHRPTELRRRIHVLTVDLLETVPGLESHEHDRSCLIAPFTKQGVDSVAGNLSCPLSALCFIVARGLVRGIGARRDY